MLSNLVLSLCLSELYDSKLFGPDFVPVFVVNSVKEHTNSCYNYVLQLNKFVLLRERTVLFNDALNTFYRRLYGVRHMVKDHSDSEKGNPLPPHRLLLSINSNGPTEFHLGSQTS